MGPSTGLSQSKDTVRSLHPKSFQISPTQDRQVENPPQPHLAVTTPECGLKVRHSLSRLDHPFAAQTVMKSAHSAHATDRNTMTNIKIEAAQKSLAAAKAAHAEAIALVTETANRKAEVENAIRTGDARLGQADLIDSDTAHRTAVLVEQGKAASVRRARDEVANLQSQKLRDQIEDGTLGMHPDNLVGAKREFYESVKAAAAQLNLAVKAHNQGLLTAYNRLPHTDHWDDNARTGNRGSILRYGKGNSDFELSFMRKNGAGRTVVTAQHPGVSGLERYAQFAIFEAVHGIKIDGAPEWAE